MLQRTSSFVYSFSLVFTCIAILYASPVQAQLPTLPSLWYEYMSSYFTTYSFDGENYDFSTMISTFNSTGYNTNSVTTFYWTTFYNSFSGYWGDDYDTSLPDEDPDYYEPDEVNVSSILYSDSIITFIISCIMMVMAI